MDKDATRDDTIFIELLERVHGRARGLCKSASEARTEETGELQRAASRGFHRGAVEAVREMLRELGRASSKRHMALWADDYLSTLEAVQRMAEPLAPREQLGPSNLTLQKHPSAKRCLTHEVLLAIDDEHMEMLEPCLETEAYNRAVDHCGRAARETMKKVGQMLEPPGTGDHYGGTLYDRLEAFLFRIADEQVPLFSSNRLKNLHKDAETLILELRALKGEA